MTLCTKNPGPTLEAYGRCILQDGHEGPCMDVSDLRDGEITPRYTHVCDACTFLGRYDEFDLYYHSCSREDTVIARYGDDGGDYTSGLCFIGRNKALEHAARVAVELGALDPETRCEGAGQGTVAEELALVGNTPAQDVRDLTVALKDVEAITLQPGIPHEVKTLAVRASTQIRILIQRFESRVS